ncbi:hypothetical protein FUSO4_08050 [Fusobacterium necrophorum DJ-1]|uniref:Uncharacterized protein n=2 Tax=Fusobacterium necrophorum TaxID=859 RepID=A0AB73BVA5_9FUSO|nr:hypothetical protein FUSO3_07855 [Fusobacterium necrophorum BL]KDE64366.1 hypothetical protein FUSO4_08050 [Fusobacterium necrophorum DJ-1]KDE71040.1 hypothetical protein FUSO6_02610 [Fusobacterium necrophorum DAB]KDE72848.1 hypothetical protein FUSO8_03795 [Fusobacterium necrophorum DJ-2]KDE74389.1 hypothetical protein FUSO7_03265 [Fusobacterium necrophorum BFTR-2]
MSTRILLENKKTISPRREKRILRIRMKRERIKNEFYK